MVSTACRRQFLVGSAAVLGGSMALGLLLSIRRAIRIDNDISNVDPANRVGAVEGNVLLAVCQGLARFNLGTLYWAPDAAKSITQVSDTEIDFELKPRQMFHGGYGEMTAEDVKFSFERFITPDAQGAMVAYADDFLRWTGSK